MQQQIDLGRWSSDRKKKLESPLRSSSTFCSWYGAVHVNAPETKREREKEIRLFGLSASTCIRSAHFVFKCCCWFRFQGSQKAPHSLLRDQFDLSFFFFFFSFTSINTLHEAPYWRTENKRVGSRKVDTSTVDYSAGCDPSALRDIDSTRIGQCEESLVFSLRFHSLASAWHRLYSDRWQMAISFSTANFSVDRTWWKSTIVRSIVDWIAVVRRCRCALR